MRFGRGEKEREITMAIRLPRKEGRREGGRGRRSMSRSGGNEYLQRDGGGDIRKLSRGKDVLLEEKLKEAVVE